MDLEALVEMFSEPLTQLTVLAVTLGFFAISHTGLVLSGWRRTRKQAIKWSWARFWNDVLDRGLAILILVIVIIGIDMAQWLLPLIGITLEPTIMAVLNASAIVAIPFVAGLAELYQAARNAFKLWGWAKNVKLLGLNENDLNLTDEHYGEIAESAKKFVEALGGKTTREQLIEDGVDLTNIEGEVVGKGSGNTYIEPHRSAPKDTLIDPSTCYNRECVSYTAWKIAEIKQGNWPTRTGAMSAKYWVDRLASWGYKMVSAPKEGGKYIGVVTSGTYGHVVWFEHKIDESKVQISEYNYADAGNYGLRNVPILGYIWFEIVAPSSTVTPEIPTVVDSYTVGDTVLPIKYADYTGKKLKKTADYYTISQISGDRAVLNDGNTIYAAVNTNNLKKVDVPTSKPENPPKDETAEIEVGDTVTPTKLVDYNGTPLVQYDSEYIVTSLAGNRAVLSARGAIWAAMNTQNLRKVR